MTKTAKELAGTLNYIAKEGLVPGLLPRDVSAAADMLVAQAKELSELRAALSANEHVVDLTISEDKNFRYKVETTFVIASPRYYRTELSVDALGWRLGHEDWVAAVTKSIVRAGTQEWLREIEQKTAVAFYQNAPKEPAGEGLLG